jgi:hypothetical protein
MGGPCNTTVEGESTIIYTYIYIYGDGVIYKERDRERERDIHVCVFYKVMYLALE